MKTSCMYPVTIPPSLSANTALLGLNTVGFCGVTSSLMGTEGAVSQGERRNWTRVLNS